MAGTVQDSGGYKRLTASGNVSKVPATLIGFLVASTTAGTIQFYDDPATGTSTAVTGVFTPAAGQFIPVRASCGSGINAVIGGTLDVTVIFA